jgi:hypothetical protein
MSELKESLLNESPERNELQKAAEILADLIVALPDIPINKRESIDFTNEDIINKYLSGLHLKVQDLVNRTWDINNHTGTLSKDRALSNFIKICSDKGMSFFNPFNLLILKTINYNTLLRGRF